MRLRGCNEAHPWPPRAPIHAIRGAAPAPMPLGWGGSGGLHDRRRARARLPLHPLPHRSRGWGGGGVDSQGGRERWVTGGGRVNGNTQRIEKDRWGKDLCAPHMPINGCHMGTGPPIATTRKHKMWERHVDAHAGCVQVGFRCWILSWTNSKNGFHR